MTQKILVVDDEPMLTDLLEAHLTQRGYSVCKANNAEEALTKLDWKPDLILLDIGMPGTDGLQLCQTIRNHVGCPILFLTARIAEQDKIDGGEHSKRYACHIGTAVISVISHNSRICGDSKDTSYNGSVEIKPRLALGNRIIVYHIIYGACQRRQRNYPCVWR